MVVLPRLAQPPSTPSRPPPSTTCSSCSSDDGEEGEGGEPSSTTTAQQSCCRRHIPTITMILCVLLLFGGGPLLRLLLEKLGGQRKLMVEALLGAEDSNDDDDCYGEVSNRCLPVAPFAMTSLERVFARAFNALVADGTWSSTFGKYPEHLAPQPYCQGGNYDEMWPLPYVIDEAATEPFDAKTDLAKVMDRGKFRCGYIRDSDYHGNLNAGSAAAEAVTMIETTDTDASGLIPDFWQKLVDEVAEDTSTPIELEWKLYDTSQLTLEALAAGEIDAACGDWSTDGVYSVDAADATLPFVTVARGSVFSAMTCPIAQERRYAYASLKSGLTTFEQLVDAVDAGQINQICVSGTDGGGYETSCQNALNLHSKAARSGRATCRGQGSNAFRLFDVEIGCQAVWGGIPDDPSKYSAIPLPFLTSGVAYFRQRDLSAAADASSSDGGGGSNETGAADAGDDTETYVAKEKSARTTLELAVTQAFDGLIADGTWKDVFLSSPSSGNGSNGTSSSDGSGGGEGEGVEMTSFCMGAPENWPAPSTRQMVETGSDLDEVLKRGYLRCGYTTNQVFYAGNKLMIDTSDQAIIKGAVVEYFSRVVEAVGLKYGMVSDSPLKVLWVLQETSQETFSALYNGEIDAACGYWVPSGNWRHILLEEMMARPLAFSMMYCPTLAQTNYIYTLKPSAPSPVNSTVPVNGTATIAPTVPTTAAAAATTAAATPNNITTFDELISAIANNPTGTNFTVCVADDATGGGVSSCRQLISQYAGETNANKIECVGAPAEAADFSKWALQGLLDGTCSAAYGAYADDASLYNALESPVKGAQVTFFRTDDIQRAKVTDDAQQSGGGGSRPDEVTSAATSWNTAGSGFLLLCLLHLQLCCLLSGSCHI